MKHYKKLYIALNLGCKCNCEKCPTKNLVLCNKVTITGAVVWSELRKALRSIKDLKEVCLIGENPFRYSSGHIDFFFKLKDIVSSEFKLTLTAIADNEATQNSQILSLFKKVYIRIPESEEPQNNLMWIKGYTDLHTYIKVDEVTDDIILYLKKGFYPKPLIITDGSKIAELRQKYPDFEFSNRLIDSRVKLYSLTENRLYSNTRQLRTSKPYIEIYNKNEQIENGSNP